MYPDLFEEHLPLKTFKSHGIEFFEACMAALQADAKSYHNVDLHNPFDLSWLHGFDVAKACDWGGGIVEGTIERTVCYSYRTGESGDVMGVF